MFPPNVPPEILRRAMALKKDLDDAAATMNNAEALGVLGCLVSNHMRHSDLVRAAAPGLVVAANPALRAFLVDVVAQYGVLLTALHALGPTLQGDVVLEHGACGAFLETVNRASSFAHGVIPPDPAPPDGR